MVRRRRECCKLTLCLPYKTQIVVAQTGGFLFPKHGLKFLICGVRVKKKWYLDVFFGWSKAMNCEPAK